MPATDFPDRLSFRIVFRRNQIWFSELVGILFVGIILLCLSGFGIVALTNRSAIDRNNALLWRMKLTSAARQAELARWREKELIHETLSEFVKERLPRQTINMLVDLVYENSRTYGYDPLLVLAVIHVESVFEPEALGRYRSGKYSGAFGLMQLKFETAKEVAGDLGLSLETLDDLFEPELNVALGVAYLTRLIAQFNSLKLGILAYNQGPGVIAKSLQHNRPLSVRYYDKVLRSFYALKRMHERKHGEDA
ncbi:MAG: transglycosylase SLT domain-containing protein [Chitinivibrionales bacterium]|nr:transglycosylase SLT domain-containing protein [Chitinivibrionales bacterium]MBD3395338.1 transglycosylase SLT domain-containing protein [Chitinivibrionales bacterium]